MSSAKEIRTSIDQTLDRWEAAATAFEQSISATRTSISNRIEEKKSQLAAASEKLAGAVERVQGLPAEIKSRATSNLSTPEQN